MEGGHTEGVDFFFRYTGTISSTTDFEDTETTYWASGDETTNTNTYSYNLKNIHVSIDGISRYKNDGDVTSDVIDTVTSAQVTYTDVYGNTYDFYNDGDVAGGAAFFDDIPCHNSDYDYTVPVDYEYNSYYDEAIVFVN